MAAKHKSMNCPYCNGAMRTIAAWCDDCAVEIRSDFRETLFEQLGGEDLAFLEQYLLAGFSIKALAEASGKGYAAIRSRLDRIIDRYRTLHDAEIRKRSILSRLSSGEITAAKAAELIEGIRDPHVEGAK